MSVRFVNNFSAELTAGIDSDDTTLSFAAGVGDAFRAKLGSALGSDHVYITVYNAGGDVEYMKVTATSGDDFTVVRGQDNTTARAWLSGDMAAVRPNAAALQEAVSLPTDLARSGINLDITEMRGLEVPLSVDQGGTGVDTYAELLTALGISYPLPVSIGGTGVTNLTALKTAMGLVPGTNVMAYVTPGTAGNVLTSDGAGNWASSPAATGLVALTAQTAAGTYLDFTIPATAKRITIALKGVAATGLGTNLLYVRLGDAGGIETSGYVSDDSSYFELGESTAGMSGVLSVVKQDGNTWCLGGSTIGSTLGTVAVAGYKTLSDTLTTVRLGVSSGSLNGGSVNVLYE